MRAFWLFNQLWFIVSVNSWKNRASSELLCKSNRAQVYMVYRQPRSQGLFPILSAGRVKAVASAGHVPPYTLKSWV